MVVRELIRLLRKFPKEMRVCRITLDPDTGKLESMIPIETASDLNFFYDVTDGKDGIRPRLYLIVGVEGHVRGRWSNTVINISGELEGLVEAQGE